MNIEKIHITQIRVTGIHNRYKINLKVNKSLNIFHGQNGTGKTTLLHIIANIANLDFHRFAYLNFKSIFIKYSNNYKIIIRRVNENINITSITDSKKNFTFTTHIAQIITREDVSSHDSLSIYKLTYKEFIDSISQLRLRTSYFPAFRTVLEAWSNQRDSDERFIHNPRITSSRTITKFSRELFGEFLPDIKFPTPKDIEHNIRQELREAIIKIGRYDSTIFTESFVKIFSALVDTKYGPSQNASEIIEEISTLTNEKEKSLLAKNNSIPYDNTYQKLIHLITSNEFQSIVDNSAIGALSVYRDALYERRNFEKSILDEINKYFDTVNSFLDPNKKKFNYEIDSRKRLPKIGLQFPDERWTTISSMSSGERQILTMLYAATKMSEDSLVLIDEPELSLHIDWQEDLLQKMMSHLGDRQIIICTHSPAIATGYNEYMINIDPEITKDDNNSITYFDEDEI